MKDSTIYIKLVSPSAEKIFVLMKNQYNELNLGIIVKSQICPFYGTY